MVKFKLIGQTSYQVGKPLWEILGNLQNNGVGRLVTRGMFLRYPEPSFYKIVKVDAVAAPEVKPDTYNQWSRRCIVWVEYIFRGVKRPIYRELHWPTYKPDYQLIPREEEELWYKRAKEHQREIRVVDPHVKMPVLLEQLYKDHLRARGEEVPHEVRMKVPLALSHNNLYRLAEEGETPNYKLADKFGTPATPALYENIDAARHLFVGKNAWDDPAPKRKFDWMLH